MADCGAAVADCGAAVADCGAAVADCGADVFYILLTLRFISLLPRKNEGRWEFGNPLCKLDLFCYVWQLAACCCQDPISFSAQNVSLSSIVKFLILFVEEV